MLAPNFWVPVTFHVSHVKGASGKAQSPGLRPKHKHSVHTQEAQPLWKHYQYKQTFLQTCFEFI